MDLERGHIKLKTLPWAEARLSHAAAVAAANWDRPQVYVAEIKGVWTPDILQAHHEEQLKHQVLAAFNKDLEEVPEPHLVLEQAEGRSVPKFPSRRGFKPPTRRVACKGYQPMQNNFVAERMRGGQYGWAAQRLSRAAALAAVHWQNPRAYRAELYGIRDPEDEREEEIQIQVLGKMGGEDLEESLRKASNMKSESPQLFLESVARIPSHEGEARTTAVPG
ncbi:unnamed protein product [Durusdinium trenchii]|uniref:Uncharacterized protein n=2 Tax=Durusdinium trenchii TaxID=1381693 RepID=A0ABP0RX65_9DINO